MLVLFLTRMLPVLADHSVELSTRLSVIDGLYVQFVQRVTDSTGVLLQENRGELWIQRPSSFNYHVIFPEESFLISNGEVLWFYEPFLNQVIIRCLKDVVNSKLLNLLLPNTKTCLDWDEYHVSKHEDTFILSPKDDRNTMLQKIEIQITSQGIIQEFSILDKENQFIHYRLTQHNLCLFNGDKFNFYPPSGVIVDEQR